MVLKRGVFSFGLKQRVFLGLMDHHLALDFLLAEQRGVCTIFSTSSYTYKYFRYCIEMYKLPFPTGYVAPGTIEKIPCMISVILHVLRLVA
jgi:hypothetical protein